MAERFNQKVNLQTQNLSSGMSEGLMSLSGKFQQISNDNLAKREQSIIEESTLAGQQAHQKGVEPEFMSENKMIGGVTAKAYNNGLRAAYSASISNDIREDLAKIELENPDDVAKFKSKTEAKRASLVKEVDPVALPEVLARFDQHTTSGYIRVQDRGAQKTRKQTVDLLNANIDSLGDETARLARIGDTEASRAGLIELAKHLNAAVDAGTKTRQEADKELKIIQHEAMEQESRHTFDVMLKKPDGVNEALAMLGELEDAPPKTWTPDDWDAYISSQRADIGREKARREAGKTEVSKAAAEALKSYTKAAALGFEVSKKETSRVADLVSSDPKLKKAFDIVNTTKIFSIASRADREAVLEGAKTGNLSDVPEYASFTAANKAINDAALKDGYSLGASQGLIKPVPMDINSPESFSVKVQQANLLSNHYGVDVSPLSDAEAASLSSGLKDMTTIEKMMLANTLNSSPTVWGQISDKNQGAFAQAGATGDATVMSAVFEGQELIQNKFATPAKPKEFQADFTDYVEGVYGVQDRRDIMAATVAHYASTHPDGEYDSGDFEDSIDAVTGGVGTVNGFRVELPRGIEEGTFDDFIDDIQPETVASLGGIQGLTDERAVEIIKQGKIQKTQDGYMVIIDNQTLWSNENKPFTFEWSEELAATNKAHATQRWNTNTIAGRAAKTEARIAAKGGE